MKHQLRLYFTILSTVLFLSCNKEKNDLIYETQIAKVEPIIGELEVSGRVEANDTKKIFIDKKLKVKSVFIQEGDYVEKNQLLITFDNNELNKLKRNIKQEKILLEKLEREYKIEQELFKIGGSPKNTSLELKEQIDVKKLALLTLEEDLLETKEEIKSPVSGTITKLLAQENYSVNTDEPLLTLTDLTNIKIILEIPEYEVEDIEINQKVEIKPELFEQKNSYKGYISRISKISRTSKNTSENVLEAEVQTNEKIQKLVPGFKVSATIYIDSKTNGILISKTALLFKDNKYIVFVVNNNNILEEREVSYNVLKGNKIHITSGIQKEEKYILFPTEDLIEGMQINS